jgi:hypothetical protein
MLPGDLWTAISVPSSSCTAAQEKWSSSTKCWPNAIPKALIYGLGSSFAGSCCDNHAAKALSSALRVIASPSPGAKALIAERATRRFASIHFFRIRLVREFSATFKSPANGELRHAAQPHCLQRFGSASLCQKEPYDQACEKNEQGSSATAAALGQLNVFQELSLFMANSCLEFRAISCVFASIKSST